MTDEEFQAFVEAVRAVIREEVRAAFKAAMNSAAIELLDEEPEDED